MPLDYSKHKIILLQILKDIYNDPVCGNNLGFKGGTAAMLFYGLDRYSVDLDFDLLDENKSENVFEHITKIVQQYGTVTESRIKRFNVLNIISYAPGEPKIKIEINRRDFGSHYEVQTILGISLQVMVKADMFAHKLMAMIERIGKTSRDVYDIRFFIKHNWPMNTSIVEARAQKPYQEVLKKAIALLEQMNNKHILDGLGELLTKSQKDSTRATLRDDTIVLLKILLDSAK